MDIKRTIAVIGWLLILLTVATPYASAITDEQGGAILEELRQIRQLLERQQGPYASRPQVQGEKAKLSLGENPTTLGRNDAPVILVEFTDFECPYCKKFYDTTFLELKRNYIDTGKVRYVTRDMPLPIHQYAFRAAEAARCAGEQNAYWEAHAAFFNVVPKLSVESIDNAIAQLPIDLNAFRACLSSSKYQSAIRQDISDAEAAGIRGTPGFIMGTKEGNDSIKISGAQPYAYFDAKIKELLSASSLSNPDRDVPVTNRRH